MKINEIKNVIDKANSKGDILKLLGYHINGRNHKDLNDIIKNNNININHFDNGVSKRTKYERIEKTCPVCGTLFITKKGHKKEKVVCSRGCSNTHFKSGVNHPNYKDISEYKNRSRNFAKKYRKICFDNHEHKCVICDEDKILDVHHFDENKFNNNPNNLIPMCPTHHNYLHSKYSDEVKDKIIKYREKYILLKIGGEV